MNGPRFASLSGSLLARKGGARPAMRPRALTSGAMLDDLGWNDMGHGDIHDDHVPSSIAALTPAPKPIVHEQQRVIEERFAEEPAVEEAQEVEAAAEPVVAEAPVTEPVEPVAAPIIKAAKPAGVVSLPRPRHAGGTKKAAFTLRLDNDRHLKLRLASAITGRSSQQLVTSALDQFLETIPEVSTLAKGLPDRSGPNS